LIKIQDILSIAKRIPHGLKLQVKIYMSNWILCPRYHWFVDK